MNSEAGGNSQSSCASLSLSLRIMNSLNESVMLLPLSEAIDSVWIT